MKIHYRCRISESEQLSVYIKVPDEHWEAAFDYCNQYFCGHLPPIPDPPEKPVSVVDARRKRG